MKGTTFVGLIVGPALAMGAAMYWFQNYAYYQPVVLASKAEQSDFNAPAQKDSPMTTTIRMTLLNGGAPVEIAVTDFTGIDANTSPLKFRGCFRVPESIETLRETYLPMETPTPLQAPSWFDCFNAEQLTDDLESGAAQAFMSEQEFSFGTDRVIAVYPDGRAFAWHQFNENMPE
jgi:Family of unknown function (DUF6446)